MVLESKCANCKHRAPRNICAEERSPRYRQPVEPTDSCEFFLANPAEGHFVNGLVNAMEDQPRLAITELEKAIALGLPHDSEMQAHYFLGSAYNDVFAHSGLTAARVVELPEFTRAIREHETGVLMDRDARYGYFDKEIYRAHLGVFDMECALAGSVLADTQGSKPAIAYLEEKLKVYDHLNSTPMIQVLLKLGSLYAETNDDDKAVRSFERIVQAEPVDRLDERSIEAQTREMARGNLGILREGRNEASSGARTQGTGCMLVVAILGTALGVVAANLAF
jgi:hypothetical protein